jgi:hypothetical protein
MGVSTLWAGGPLAVLGVLVGEAIGAVELMCRVRGARWRVLARKGTGTISAPPHGGGSQARWWPRSGDATQR